MVVPVRLVVLFPLTMVAPVDPFFKVQEVSP
jgi:hypothetical protein